LFATLFGAPLAHRAASSCGDAFHEIKVFWIAINAILSRRLQILPPYGKFSPNSYRIHPQYHTQKDSYADPSIQHGKNLHFQQVKSRFPGCLALQKFRCIEADWFADRALIFNFRYLGSGKP
jgi:hypothetical protein